MTSLALLILQSLSECVNKSPNTLIFGIHNHFYGSPHDAVSRITCLLFAFIFFICCTYLNTFLHNSRMVFVMVVEENAVSLLKRDNCHAELPPSQIL